MKLRKTVACLALLSLPLQAQTLNRVRVETPRARALAAQLDDEGWDVLEGSIAEGSLELVIRDEEFSVLRERGLSPELIEKGRPFRAIQAAFDVPAGYPDLAAIEAEMALAAATFPNIAKLVDVTAQTGSPTTFEGRHLFALKISDNPDLEEDEPAILVVSAHHCRELVTPLIALTAIEQLTSGYGVDAGLTDLVNEHEIWIAPMWNPDGYVHVFDVDNLWRKNRRVFPTGIGVDQNRNYPFGWNDTCGGSTSVTSQTYKGPSPASEPETQTMMALSEEQRFSKVLDFHSSGREVLWGYDCRSHPFDSFLLSEAIDLSFASGYAGAERPPTAHGEHYEWQLATYASHSFLVETHTTFQPSLASAEAEALQVWGGIRWMLEREIPVTGRVRDLCSGEPVATTVTPVGVPYTNGEVFTNGGAFGRYDLFLPAASGFLQFTSAGFDPGLELVNPTTTTSELVDVDLASSTVATLSGSGQIGTTVFFDMDSPSDALGVHVAAVSASGTSPGFPVNACSLPLNFDFLFLKSITGSAPFGSFVGFLDGSGHATASLDLPNDGSLVGLEMDFAFATLEGGSVARHVSNAEHLTIVP